MSSGKLSGYNGATAADIARAGSAGPGPGASRRGKRETGRIPLERTDALVAEDSRSLRRKVAASAAVLAVLAFLSLCPVGAAGGNDPAYVSSSYHVYTPWEVAYAIYTHAYNLLAVATHAFSEVPYATCYEMPAYYAVVQRAGVIGITLVAAVLLSVSGALYQAVFRNPIAGPGMLGVSSGVQLGVMVLVAAYGTSASAMVGVRYGLCYGLGAAILAFVVLVGRKMSGKGRSFDIVNMMLIGSILSQLFGLVVSFVTLYVMDPDIYEVYYSVSEMLVVDVSPVSWACLGVATLVSLYPVWRNRFKLNALSFPEEEVCLMGVNATAIRALALVCGGVMILAAQIHIGAVAMVSLVVPFLARSWFGCEFRHQLVGNVCISTVLLVACRDIVDLIPFVGDGLGIGSAVSVVALPLFLVIVSKHMRGWE